MEPYKRERLFNAIILIAALVLIVLFFTMPQPAQPADEMIRKEGTTYKIYDSTGLTLRSQLKWNNQFNRYDQYDSLGLWKTGEVKESSTLNRWEYNKESK